MAYFERAEQQPHQLRCCLEKRDTELGRKTREVLLGYVAIDGVQKIEQLS